MGVTVEQDAFGFYITDPQTGLIIFDTRNRNGINGSLKFLDKYLEFGFRIPSQRVFGLGEKASVWNMATESAMTYTLFNRDQPNPKADGSGCQNEYGSHPFFASQLSNKQIIGLFFRNTNAMSIVIVKNEDGSSNIYFKSIGGVFDVYFFYSNDFEGLIQQYHQLIGKPSLVPFWSLGFHQSRWGWKSLKEVYFVLKNYKDHDIPLETI